MEEIRKEMGPDLSTIEIDWGSFDVPPDVAAQVSALRIDPWHTLRELQMQAPRHCDDEARALQSLIDAVNQGNEPKNFFASVTAIAANTLDAQHEENSKPEVAAGLGTDMERAVALLVLREHQRILSDQEKANVHYTNLLDAAYWRGLPSAVARTVLQEQPLTRGARIVENLYEQHTPWAFQRHVDCLRKLAPFALKELQSGCPSPEAQQLLGNYKGVWLNVGYCGDAMERLLQEMLQSSPVARQLLLAVLDCDYCSENFVRLLEYLQAAGSKMTEKMRNMSDFSRSFLAYLENDGPEGMKQDMRMSHLAGECMQYPGIAEKMQWTSLHTNNAPEAILELTAEQRHHMVRFFTDRSPEKIISVAHVVPMSEEEWQYLVQKMGKGDREKMIELLRRDNPIALARHDVGSALRLSNEEREMAVGAVAEHHPFALIRYTTEVQPTETQTALAHTQVVQTVNAVHAVIGQLSAYKDVSPANDRDLPWSIAEGCENEEAAIRYVGRGRMQREIREYMGSKLQTRYGRSLHELCYLLSLDPDTRQMGLPTGEDVSAALKVTHHSLRERDVLELLHTRASELQLPFRDVQLYQHVYRNICRVSRVIHWTMEQYPHHADLFRHLFGCDPHGQLDVIQGVHTLYVRCYDERDYLNALSVGEPDTLSEKEKKRHSKAGGCVIRNDRLPNGLGDAITLERVRRDSHNKSMHWVYPHEEQHAYHTLLFDGLLPITQEQFLRRVKENGVEMDQSPENHVQFVEEGLRLLREMRMEIPAMEEILCYSSIGSSRSEILRTLIRRDKEALYDYAVDVHEDLEKAGMVAPAMSSNEVLLKQIFDTEYTALLKEALDAFEELKGMVSLEIASEMLTIEPLRRWPAVVDVLRKVTIPEYYRHL